jgi:hypothetical protein
VECLPGVIEPPLVSLLPLTRRGTDGGRLAALLARLPLVGDAMAGAQAAARFMGSGVDRPRVVADADAAVTPGMTVVRPADCNGATLTPARAAAAAAAKRPMGDAVVGVDERSITLPAALDADGGTLPLLLTLGLPLRPPMTAV